MINLKKITEESIREINDKAESNSEKLAKKLVKKAVRAILKRAKKGQTDASIRFYTLRTFCPNSLKSYLEIELTYYFNDRVYCFVGNYEINTVFLRW